MDIKSLFYTIGLFSLFSFSSCNKEEVVDNDETVIEAEEYLTIKELSESGISVPADKGVYVLKVESDKEWTASLDDDWCILSTTSGVDYTKVYIGFNENEWNIERSMCLTFKISDEEIYSVSLKQEPAETVFNFEPQVISIIKKGQTKSVAIETTAFEWSVSCLDEQGNNVGWVTVDGGSESYSGSQELTFTVTENNSETSRLAYLVFKSGENVFENKLTIEQTNIGNVFDDFSYQINDNSQGLTLSWNKVEGASYKLTLATDEQYTDIIDNYNNKDIDSEASNTFNLLSVQYGDYMGTVYAKISGVCGTDGFEKEFTFNTSFDAESGDGSSIDQAIIIKNSRHLNNITGISTENKYFLQKADIDLQSQSFTPLCAELSASDYNGEFKGTYDGGGYKIGNISFNSSGSNVVGLFSTIAANGIVKNVTLSNINITAGNFVGGIAGKCFGTIENCIVESGSVTGNARVGGIVGQLPSGKPSVKKCINKADVKSVMTSGDSFVGGIVGQSDQITRGTVIISQCGNEGEIYSPCNFVGGIIGRSVIKSEINQCYNKGKVTGASLVGGILGQSNALVLQNCYNSAEVIGTGTAEKPNVGGILGNSTNTDMIIKNCYNVGTITKGYGLTKGGDNDGKNIPLTSCITLSNAAASPVLNVAPGGYEVKSASEMKQQTTYNGWDFTSIWSMPSSSYPKLKWEN
ncbi:BACON domain-containing protein [uncultured Bacteroides sp.]|uniref:BACON domain-containing protein n=1 Tax=uncultured Bacteroides sp. TaxID=162156 RepID=UPI0025F47867|nr:BACON domain-containing protein [uncultured Bacteroides sp.]